MAAASLLKLPYELRERILLPSLRQKGAIELQYPVWAEKAVFTHPITQVCRQLREETVQVFYRVNVFIWVIDPDEDNRPDPTKYPLEPNGSKDAGPSGPLVSGFPWKYPLALQNLRHLRLNMYLPMSHDKKAWTETFPKKLAGFINSIDNGRRLKSLKILIGTWYTLLNFSTSQAAVLDILEQMQVRGTVQVRTKNIYKETKYCISGLDLENRIRDGGAVGSRVAKGKQEDQPGGRYLDWEWEGGLLLS